MRSLGAPWDFAGYPCAIIAGDVLIGGKTVEEHDANLRKVLNRARGETQSSQVQVLAEPGKDRPFRRLAMIGEKPNSTDAPAVQRIVGMAICLGRLIPNLSKLTAPLPQLTSEMRSSKLSSRLRRSFELNDYIYGNPVTIETDLVTILNNSASSRLRG